MEDLLEEQQLTESESLDLARYFKALARKWWLVLIIILGVSLPWAYYLKQQPPSYQAEVWVRFELETGQLQESMIQGRNMTLQSRSFAEEVVVDLGLALEIEQNPKEGRLMRQDVFRYVSTSRTPVAGQYVMKFYPDGSCAIYHESDRIDSLKTFEMVEDTVSYNGVQFVLNPDIANKRNTVRFKIDSFSSSVKSLRARERINNSQAGDLMQILFTDQDPDIAAQTVNMLADIFIRKSLDIQRENVALQSDHYKKQMETVEEQRRKKDAEWRALRGSYLQGFEEETKRTLERLRALDNQKLEMIQNKEDLNRMLGRLNPTSDNAITEDYIYPILANHSVFRGDTEMDLVRNALNDLTAQRTRMLENLTRVHRDVIEVEDKIREQQARVRHLVAQKITSLEKDIEEIQVSIDAEQQAISNLPREEIRQIDLERERTALNDQYDLLNRRYNDAKLSEAVPAENAHIIDYALPPEIPVNANKKKLALIGFALALMLGVGTVVVIEIADKRIRSRDDIKKYLRLPLLGIIPKVKFNDYELQDADKAKSISSQIVTHDYSPTPVGEAYRSLRTNILFSKNFGPIRSMAIGSVAPGEGKSFTATNMAITLAQQKTKTLLIDADLRRGVLHNTFNCPKKPGLTNYLTGVAPLDKVLNETYIPNLSLITCGSMIPNPSEVLGSVRMKRFIEGISSRFDFIIFDTPPLMAATDAIILSTLVDGIAVLIRAGETSRDDVQKKMELFQNVEVNVMGAILNCAGVDVAHDGYSYYRY